VDLFAIGVSVHVRGVAESLDNSPFSITQAEANDADRMMAVAIAFKGVALLVTGGHGNAQLSGRSGSDPRAHGPFALQQQGNLPP
ncbi:hypothetical protein ACWDR0_34355, partial [Streptomyces sp. NPDC003691]